MAILAFQKPDKVVMLESDDFFGKFEFRPLEPGYGTTVGNSLRRILLSSLEGFAITNIKINGVEQEFSSIEGVLEDVPEIILNLKKICFKRQIESITNEKVVVTLSGKDVIKAGEMNAFLSGFQVLNTEEVICHLEPEVILVMEITIDKGLSLIHI